MFIRIPGDKANEAELGSYDTATILDATSHPVRVVAKAEGIPGRPAAERAMLNVAAVGGGTATVTVNGVAAVMVWVAD